MAMLFSCIGAILIAIISSVLGYPVIDNRSINETTLFVNILSTIIWTCLVHLYFLGK
jgi:hypothetical protein